MSALLLVYRYLRNSFELVFDRIFNGDDLVFLVLDLHDGAVQGRGLAVSCGTGDQHHAVGLGNVLPETSYRPFGKADIQAEILELFADRFLSRIRMPNPR